MKQISISTIAVRIPPKVKEKQEIQCRHKPDRENSLVMGKSLIRSSYTRLTMNTKAKIKCWGNSLGIVLPKTLVEEEGLKEGEEVEVTVRKTSNVTRLRGKFPFQNLQHEKEEMKRGWE